jgi:hypothetical protein
MAVPAWYRGTRSRKACDARIPSDFSASFASGFSGILFCKDCGFLAAGISGGGFARSG